MKWSAVWLLLLIVSLAREARAQDADVWASAETLLWWVSDGSAPPPLATTAPTGTTSLIPGALGEPDTTIVLGGGNIQYLPFKSAGD